MSYQSLSPDALREAAARLRKLPRSPEPAARDDGSAASSLNWSAWERSILIREAATHLELAASAVGAAELQSADGPDAPVTSLRVVRGSLRASLAAASLGAVISDFFESAVQLARARQLHGIELREPSSDEPVCDLLLVVDGVESGDLLASASQVIDDLGLRARAWIHEYDPHEPSGVHQPKFSVCIDYWEQPS